MHAESGSGTTSPVVDGEGGASSGDLVETLLARVDDIEEQLRAIPAATDEKALKELRRTIEALSKRDPKFEERVTNRVDVVADRIETVARTVSTTAAALAAKDGEIARVRRELETGSGRVDAAVADLRRSLDPAAFPEIKRALAALSEQKLPRGLEGRIEDLNAKLGMLSQRVDTVSSTVSTTAAGLAGREGDVTAFRRTYEANTARIDAELADVRRAIDPAPVVELRQAVKELSDAAFGQKRSNQRQLDEVGAKIDTLVGRLDSFAATVAATATRVSGSEEEISALRANVEDGGARLSSLVAEQKQTVAALAARAAALEDADGEAARLLDARVSGVGGKVDDLADRLDSLTGTVAMTSERLGKQDVELVGIERRFQEASSRVDALVGDLTRALEEFPDPDSLDQALQARIDELVGQVVELSSHLTQVKATLSEQARDAASGSAELEQLLVTERGKVDDLAGRLDSLATSAVATATRISGTEAEISAIRAYVEDGASRLSSLVAELRHTVTALAARAAALEDADGEAARVLDERVSGVSGLVDRLAAQLDSLATSAAATSTRVSGSEDEISALRAYVEDGASRLSLLVAELRKTVAALSTRATALEEAEGEAARVLDERVSGVSGSVDHLAAQLDSLTVTVGTTSERLGERNVELDALLSEIAGRLDTVERERDVTREATRAGARSHEVVGIRIEELAARLDATEEERDGTSAEVTRLAAILEVERASLRARLDTLAAAQEKWAGSVGTGEFERGVDGRFDALESERKAMAAELGRMSSAIGEERASVQTQLEALAAALSLPVSSSPYSSLEARLDELTQKLDEVDRRGAAVASDVSRATMLWPTALRSLEAKIDEVAPRPNEPRLGLEDDQHLLAGLESGTEKAEPVATENMRPPEKMPEDEPSSRDTVGRAVTTVGADVVRLRAADL